MKKLILGLLFGLIWIASPAQQWRAAGGGLFKWTWNDAYYTIRVLHADTTRDMLFAGGVFLDTLVERACHLYGLRNQQWQLMSDSSLDTNPVRHIGQYGSKILISGTLAGLVIWEDGQLDTIPEAGAISSYEKEGILYVGGGHDDWNELSPGIVQWDGQQWSGVCGGMYAYFPNHGGGYVYTLGSYKNHLIAGGNVLNGKNEPELDLKYLLDSTWQPIPGWVNGGFTYVNDVLEYQGDLYVAGGFHKDRGALANGIVRWDGQQWYELGQGITDPDGVPIAMAVMNDELYVAGLFTEVDGLPAYNIAKWDGQRWYSFSLEPFDRGRYFTSIAVLNDTLYAAGSLVGIGGNNLGNVVYWDGPTDSLTGPVHATNLISTPSKPPFSLYPNPASGSFTLKAEGLTRDEFQIEVTDARGRVVWQRQVSHPGSSFRQFIDLEDVSEGIYLVRITGREQQGLQRVQVR